tara:strand:+ start:149 stop:724 length:576 start_codon:yes stop_codon:yes gene_type:complete
MTSKVLICIDFIEEIIGKNGALASQGYLEFAKEQSTLDNLSKALEYFRKENLPVIHVRLGFSDNYLELPESSPLFKNAKQYGILKANSNSTAFVKEAKPYDEEPVLTKPRVSAFFNTALESYLKQLNIKDIYIAGVATDLTVEATARDAHDRDYRVYVLSNCCAAASKEEHDKSLKLISKIGSVVSLHQIV